MVLSFFLSFFSFLRTTFPKKRGERREQGEGEEERGEREKRKEKRKEKEKRSKRKEEKEKRKEKGGKRKKRREKRKEEREKRKKLSSPKVIHSILKDGSSSKSFLICQGPKKGALRGSFHQRFPDEIIIKIKNLKQIFDFKKRKGKERKRKEKKKNYVSFFIRSSCNRTSPENHFCFGGSRFIGKYVN